MGGTPGSGVCVRAAAKAVVVSRVGWPQDAKRGNPEGLFRPGAIRNLLSPTPAALPHPGGDLGTWRRIRPGGDPVRFPLCDALCESGGCGSSSTVLVYGVLGRVSGRTVGENPHPTTGKEAQ